MLKAWEGVVMKRVTINIASTRSDGTSVQDDYREHVRDYVLRRFGTLYGGASAQDGVGSWVDDAGRLIVEPNIFVWSYAETVDDIVLNRIAKVVGRALQQDAVMVAVDEGSTVNFV